MNRAIQLEEEVDDQVRLIAKIHDYILHICSDENRTTMSLDVLKQACADHDRAIAKLHSLVRERINIPLIDCTTLSGDALKWHIAFGEPPCTWWFN